MRKDLEHGYIPSCMDCQQLKSRTIRPPGPLHPLPVPDECCESIAIDFIGPLPVDDGHNCLMTVTDRLNSDYRFIPTTTDASAEHTAEIFFNGWYCKNSLPLIIISDRDKLFTSRFWKHLCLLTGIDHKCSSAYHPQTDGASERTNKTVIQMLHFHIERNQTGWVQALPRIRFQIMNTVNKLTSYSLFQLQYGKTPRILPPLTASYPSETKEATNARDIIKSIQTDVANAKDNLLLAKITQSFQANKHRSDSFLYKIGDWVWIDTDDCRRDFKDDTKGRMAKLMPRNDGLFRSRQSTQMPPRSRSNGQRTLAYSQCSISHMSHHIDRTTILNTQAATNPLQHRRQQLSTKKSNTLLTTGNEGKASVT
jgi:hypothetical protein